jgi:hypothetical protein
VPVQEWQPPRIAPLAEIVPSSPKLSRQPFLVAVRQNGGRSEQRLAGDRLSVELKPTQSPAFKPEAMPLCKLCLRMNFLLVLIKPVGLVVHPALPLVTESTL